MAQSSLRFAKIVATPTDTAWSQAYNEGSVFAVLSLAKSKDIEPESLNTIGKEVLSIFRSEFFAGGTDFNHHDIYTVSNGYAIRVNP